MITGIQQINRLPISPLLAQEGKGLLRRHLVGKGKTLAARL